MLQRRMLQSAFYDLPLAFEFLQALASERSPKRSTENEGEEEELELGGEDLVLAQQLALLVQPDASSLAALLAQSRVLVIRAISYDEVSRTVDMLEAAVNFAYGESGLAKEEKSEERYPLILSTAKSGFRTSPANALSAAFRAGALVICVTSHEAADNDTKSVELAADLLAQLPPITQEMTARIFKAAFGAVPAQLEQCTGYETLNGSSLGAIVRPTRPLHDCVAALCRVLRGPPLEAAKEDDIAGREQLDEIFGYGRAKEWAADLATDYALWRAGELSWSEVPDHAALLSGSPGTGKSTFPRLLAKAIGVPLIETSVAEWNAHRNLSGTLTQMSSVFASARESRGILFIDECDGIGRRDRSDDQYRAYWDQIVNQMLTLVSEAIATEGVILIAATNYPDRIDPALLRAGRLERHIHLDLPDESARAGILQQYAKVQFSSQELVQLASATEGYSGADLQRLVRNAAAACRRKGAVLGFQALLEELARPLDKLGPEDRRRMNIYVQGQHLVSELLGVKRGTGPAYPTLNELRDQLAVLVAGRVAEEMLLGQGSVLAEADLVRATALAEAIEMRWGMGSLGLIAGVEQGPRAPLILGRYLDDAALLAARLLSENLGELERRSSASETPPTAIMRVGSGTTLH